MASSSSSSNHHHQQQQQAPFVVQGVSLVVDQRGKEARMIFRYPSSNPTQLDPISDNSNQNNNNKGSDLFFRMGPRQMAKLFRPQPSLCGQPMTLSVGGTIFCCRAVLLGDSGSSASSSTSTTTNDSTTDKGGNSHEHHNNNNSDEKAELFSIIVALQPRVSELSMPITGGWYEEEEASHTRTTTTTTTTTTNDKKDGNASIFSTNKATTAFLAIVRTHLSLNRLCRVLEREERRCQYVTLQSMLVLKIRQMFIEQQQQTNTATAVTPSASNKRPPRHNSSTTAPPSLVDETTPGTAAGQAYGNDNATTEYEQDVLETAMTSAPPETAHKGNLVRELVQFYHILSQSEDDFPTTSPTVLGMDNIIHVNGHLAVVVEAVAQRAQMQYYYLDSSSNSNHQRLLMRPYQTLLFPNKTRRELVQYLAASSAPRPVQQFLMAASPQKPLSDIASDANLSEQNALEIASYLLQEGVAVASPIITPHSRLVCTSVPQIQDAVLAFSYTFGPDVDIFALVAYLTSGWTLEEARRSLFANNASPEATLLRASLRRAIDPAASGPEGVPSPDISTSPTDHSSMEENLRLEEILYRMSFWLCARQVVAQLLEYMIEPMDFGRHHHSSDNKEEESVQQEKKTENISKEHILLEQLRKEDCLSGRISLYAASWKLRIDVALLRDFAARNSNVSLIARLPTSGDDWESAGHFC